MPRIPHSLLQRANKISPLLPLILRATRTLPSAIRELRWLDEHVKHDSTSFQSRDEQRWRLIQLCRRRERGEPLQYILGSQPFGELDIKCRPGVLIPRPETEAYTSHLARLVLEGSLHSDLKPENFDSSTERRSRTLKVLDLCSGSGCISLHLFSRLSSRIQNIKISGYDISDRANKLSIENLRIAETNNFSRKAPIEFRKVDIFAEPNDQLWMEPESKSVDIIISNPPYISQGEFYKSTARSVRIFEPKLALVPEGHGPGHDLLFFRRLLVLHEYFQSLVLIMETAGNEQCLEVAREARQICGEDNRVEIWRDWPDMEPQPGEDVEMEGFIAKGSGSYRSVVLIRGKDSKADLPKKLSLVG